MAAVTAATAILSLAAGRGAGTIVAAAAVLAGQLFTGWTNDLHDAELDRSQGRSEKPIAAGEIEASTVRGAAAAALAATVVLSLANGVPAAAVHLVAVAAAAAYNLLLKSTAASVLPYALAFALLPCFVTLGLPVHRWPPVWAPLAGGLLGAGAHFTQSLPDIGRDRERGLPARLGILPSAGAAAILLLGAVAAATFGAGSPGPVAVAALVVATGLAAAILALAALGRFTAAFRTTLAIAGVAVAGFLVSGRSL